MRRLRALWWWVMGRPRSGQRRRLKLLLGVSLIALAAQADVSGWYALAVQYVQVLGGVFFLYSYDKSAFR